MPGATKIWATVQLLPQAGTLLPFEKGKEMRLKHCDIWIFNKKISQN